MTIRAALRLMAAIPQMALAYRGAVVFSFFGLLTRIYLYAVLWRALYAAGQTVAGIDHAGAVTYSTLAALQAFSLFGPDGYIRSAVRDGSISYALMRPVGLVAQLFAMGLGGFLYGIVWIATGLFIAKGQGVAIWPSGGAQIGLYALSLFLAHLVQFHFGLLIGLSAFWTIEVFGVATIFRFSSQILSGAIIPLWFFPAWLQDVATALPFAAAAHAPLSIFIGRLNGPQVWHAMALQTIWVGVLCVTAHLVWQLAKRKVVVQGG